MTAKQSGTWKKWSKNNLNLRKGRRLPTGVTKQTGCKGYRAMIEMNNKCIHLGVFPTPTEAGQRYQGALAAKRSGNWTKWFRNNPNPQKERPLPTGVTERGERYRALISVDNKDFHLGMFPTPTEAGTLYQDALTAKLSGTWKEWAEENLRKTKV